MNDRNDGSAPEKHHLKKQFDKCIYIKHKCVHTKNRICVFMRTAKQI